MINKIFQNFTGVLNDWLHSKRIFVVKRSNKKPKFKWVGQVHFQDTYRLNKETRLFNSVTNIVVKKLNMMSHSIY